MSAPPTNAWRDAKATAQYPLGLLTIGTRPECSQCSHQENAVGRSSGPSVRNPRASQAAQSTSPQCSRADRSAAAAASSRSWVRVSATGKPHCGHAAARSETWCSHSGQSSSTPQRSSLYSLRDIASMPLGVSAAYFVASGSTTSTSAIWESAGSRLLAGPTTMMTRLSGSTRSFAVDTAASDETSRIFAR